MYKIITLVFVLFSSNLFSQTYIPPTALQEDAKLLWKGLNELHPGLYRHTDTLELEQAYANLLDYFSTEKSVEEAFLCFSEFTAKIKCGHTYPNPFNQNNNVIKNIFEQKKLLPFTFKIFDNQIIVNQSVDKKLNFGDIITTINGIPSEKIITSLMDYIKADGDRDNKRLIDLEITGMSKYEYFDFLFPIVYGVENEVELGIKNSTQVGTKNLKIDLITSKERSEKLKKSFPEITPNYDDLWSFNIENKNTAILKFGSFVTWKMQLDWEEFIDKAFEEINAKNIPNLIIDIRGNEGGNSEVPNYIIKKIAKKSGRTVDFKPHLRYKKVSPEIRPHVSTWSKFFYNNMLWTKKLNETYRTFRFNPIKSKKIKANKNAYQGKVYLMIDAANSSATFHLSQTCSNNKLATLVGTETGGTKKGINGGQMFFMTLPNSKIEVDIPLIGYYPTTPAQDTGIQPDIQIEQSLEDFINGKDTQLEKVKALISK